MSLIRYQSPELSAWTPFDRLASLRDEVNRLFDFSSPALSRDAGLFGTWAPALDVSHDQDHVYVRAELPGMKKEDIDISLHNGMISISGERKRFDESKGGENHRSERFFGRFNRSVALPTRVDHQKVEASYKDGVLHVTLPKAEEAKPKQIKVNVD